MSLETLKTLIEERKWYDFSHLVIKLSKEANDKQALDSMLHLFIELLPRIHPLSIASTTVALLSRLQTEEALGLINCSISAIRERDENIYKEELCCLSMHKCMISVYAKRYENIESQIISWMSQKLSDENYYFLLLLAGNFYESIGNVENAQEYFLKHAKATNKVEDVEKLVRLSIISRTFFDFSSVMAFNEYRTLQNNDLKNIFDCFLEGDVSKVNLQDIMRALNIKDAEFIKEKFFLINIIVICFKSEHKYVSFDVFMAKLCVDEIMLLKLLLKALGTGVISGWIDSEKRTLFFSRVIPRALNAEELEKMKAKFVEWKRRVDEAIVTIKTEF